MVKRLSSFNQINFDSSTQCRMNYVCCLVFCLFVCLFVCFLRFPFFFLFLASPKNFEVATFLKHLLIGWRVLVINTCLKNFDSAPTKQVLIDRNQKHGHLLLIKTIKQQIKELKKAKTSSSITTMLMPLGNKGT